MSLPYEDTQAGMKALTDAEKILRKFGCSNFGVMQDWERGCILVQFVHRGRHISIEASWRGYAEAWKREHPYNSRHHRGGRADYEARAKRKGEMAVPSILRDWIKGQVTAVEVGMMPFEHAFLSHMLLADGSKVTDAAVKLLPPPASGT